MRSAGTYYSNRSNSETRHHISARQWMPDHMVHVLWGTFLYSKILMCYQCLSYLTPIEHIWDGIWWNLWWTLPSEPASLEEMGPAIVRKWNNDPHASFITLVCSRRGCCQACINENSWHTEYWFFVNCNLTLVTLNVHITRITHIFPVIMQIKHDWIKTYFLFNMIFL